jgi:predicted esterase
MQKIIHYSFILISLSACNPTDISVIENKFLDTNELVNTIEKEAFKSQLTSVFGNNTSQIALFVQSGIEQYRVVYDTKDVYGNSIKASGAVMIPTDIKKNLAMGSLHHGTLFNEQDAPSYLKFESETTLATFLASTGIIVGMPDYVGYGESKNTAHPYEHYKGLGEPNADFIRAMVELVKEKNLEWNGVLMLAGYSEGGYAAMATLKWIDEKLANELAVKVSVLGAGAYNKTASFKKLVNEKGSTEINNNRSYIWVLQTYNEIYGLNKPMSYFFKEPYATEVTNKGKLAEITISLNEAISDEFRSDINKGSYAALKAAIADNDIYDWKPKSKIRLFHGTSDEYVPLINSSDAFSAMKAKGVDIEFSPIEGGTHGTSINEYFFGVLLQFTNNKGVSVQ